MTIIDANRRPSINFVYEMLEDAKNEIKITCNRKETAFRPNINIIEKESRTKLNSTLHLASYYLNPYYYYRDSTIQNDILVRNVVMHCICIFYSKHDIQDQVAHMNFSCTKRN